MGRDQVIEFYEQANEYFCFMSENVITADTVPYVMEQLMNAQLFV